MLLLNWPVADSLLSAMSRHPGPKTCRDAGSECVRVTIWNVPGLVFREH